MIIIPLPCFVISPPTNCTMRNSSSSSVWKLFHSPTVAVLFKSDFFVKLPQLAHFLSFSLESRLRNFLGISHLILGCECASHFVGTVPSRLFFFTQVAWCGISPNVWKLVQGSISAGSRPFCLHPDFHLANITDFANTIERGKECKTYHQQMNDFIWFLFRFTTRVAKSDLNSTDISAASAAFCISGFLLCSLNSLDISTLTLCKVTASAFVELYRPLYYSNQV